MKKIGLTYLFLITAAASLLPECSPAASRYYWEKRCRQLMADRPAKVVIAYNFGELSYDMSLSSAQIKEKDIEKRPRSQYSNIMGLTLTNQYHNYAVTDSGPIEMGDGYYCTIPLEVKIMTGYLDPIIYLANSMEKGTCVFRKTVRHEQQHLDLAHIYLQRYVKELEKRVPLMIKETGPLLSLSSNPEKGLLQIYQEKLDVMFDFYFNEWRENTRKMDSNENYERESRLCR